MGRRADHGRIPGQVAALAPARRHGRAPRRCCASGRTAAARVTYTNPHRWLPAFRPATATRPCARWSRGYLHAYGPATPQHFAKWLGIPVARPPACSACWPRARARRAGRRAGMDLGRRHRDAARAAPRHPAAALLRRATSSRAQPRDRLYPGPAAARALTPAGQAGNYPVLLVDGVVGGVWHQRRSGGAAAAITVEPPPGLSAPQRRPRDHVGRTRGRGRWRRRQRCR